MPSAKMSFAEAIAFGTMQAMSNDDSVVLLGIGVDYPSGIFGTTFDAFKAFGPNRVIDVPAMENAITGIRKIPMSKLFILWQHKYCIYQNSGVCVMIDYSPDCLKYLSFLCLQEIFELRRQDSYKHFYFLKTISRCA